MEGLIFGILRYLNEDMIVAVVIAIKAIANKPENKNFGTSKGFEPTASTLVPQCSTIEL